MIVLPPSQANQRETLAPPMTIIPEVELELLINTADRAARYAVERQLVEGQAELVYGWRRSQVLQGEGEPWADELAERYRAAVEAYIVAKAVVALGGTTKGAAILLAVLGLLVVGIAVRDVQGSTSIVLGAAGVVLAAFFVGVLYLLGIMVSAEGQILQASLDTAVSSSPFLTNDERAEAMSLRA